MKKVPLIKKLRLFKEKDVEEIKFFMKLVKELKEPNIYLLERIVFFIPKIVLCKLLKETHTIIKSGGYPTKDNSRLKTPGGIFFKLVKNQITHEEFKKIWNLKSKKKNSIIKLKYPNTYQINNIYIKQYNQINKEEEEEEEEGMITEENILTEDLNNMVL